MRSWQQLAYPWLRDSGFTYAGVSNQNKAEQDKLQAIPKLLTKLKTDKSPQTFLSCIEHLKTELKVIKDDYEYAPELCGQGYVALKMTVADQLSLLAFLLDLQEIHDVIKGIIPPDENREEYNKLFYGFVATDSGSVFLREKKPD